MQAGYYKAACYLNEENAIALTNASVIISINWKTNDLYGIIHDISKSIELLAAFENEPLIASASLFDYSVRLSNWKEGVILHIFELN